MWNYISLSSWHHYTQPKTLTRLDTHTHLEENGLHEHTDYFPVGALPVGNFHLGESGKFHQEHSTNRRSLQYPRINQNESD